MTKEISAGASLSIKLSLPHNQYENVDCGFWASFKEEVPDLTTDEECAKIALGMMERARGMIEEKIDNDIHQVKDVQVFNVLKKG
jgi:hypothetical protein